MRIVVDASVAVKWFVLEANSEHARRLLASDATLVAPDLIVAETANVMWKRQRVGGITPEQATEAVAALPLIFAELLPSAHLVARAAAIARALDHPVYDCFYLAAAEDLAAELEIGRAHV